MMKNNLILTAILICLLFFTYFTEEVWKNNQNKKNKLSEKLINSTLPMTEIKTKSYHFVKNEGHWEIEGISWGIDQELIQEIVDTLKSIRVNSIIETKNKVDYFKDNNIEFNIKIEGQWKEFVLGSVSKVTGAFYIYEKSDKNKVYVCYDNSLLKTIYSSEVELDFNKYIRLKKIMKANKFKFLDHNIFYGNSIESVEKVKIDSKRNRWFELNNIEKTTKPAILADLKYLQFNKIIKKSIRDIRIKKIIESGKNILSNPASSLSFQKGGKEYSYKLFSALNGQYGKFLKISNQSIILELDLPEKNLFYLNVQDFWKKKINFEVNFKEISEIKFELGFSKERYYPFLIEDMESFDVKSSDKQVNFISKVHMNFLFNLILNLADFKQAEYVESSKLEGGVEHDLYIKLFSKEFSIKVESEFIRVFDIKQSLHYIYKYNTQQIEPGFFDKIFTVKNK